MEKNKCLNILTFGVVNISLLKVKLEMFVFIGDKLTASTLKLF